jgi:hypothetical protein
VASSFFVTVRHGYSKRPVLNWPPYGKHVGGSTDRPDLQRLLDDIRARKIDVIVVYKVDRLTRSLAVCTESLSPGVVMMKSAEYRVRTDDSGALNRARDRRIFIQ